MAASQIATQPITPAPTSILGATITSGTAVTLITIPANRTWYGTVAAECAATTAASSATLLIVGSTATPAAGTLLKADAVGATGGLGVSNANHMHNVYISAGSSSATVSGTIIGTGSVSINGVLL